MHHFKGNARLNQRLIETQSRLLDFFAGLLSAVVQSALLRVDQAYARQRAEVPEVFFVGIVPGKDLFDDGQPAAVDGLGVEFDEPRAQPLRDAVGNPKANLVAVLHRVFPAMLVVDADVEHARDGFAAHGGAVFLAVLAVGPWSHDAAPALAIGNHGGRKLGNGLHVEIAQRAAAGIGNVARVRVDRADLLIPQTPKIEETLLPPEDVLLARRILRVQRCAAGQAPWPRGSSAGSARSSTCRCPPSGW